MIAHVVLQVILYFPSFLYLLYRMSLYYLYFITHLFGLNQQKRKKSKRKSSISLEGSKCRSDHTQCNGQTRQHNSRMIWEDAETMACWVDTQESSLHRCVWGNRNTQTWARAVRNHKCQEKPRSTTHALTVADTNRKHSASPGSEGTANLLYKFVMSSVFCRLLWELAQIINLVS